MRITNVSLVNCDLIVQIRVKNIYGGLSEIVGHSRHSNVNLVSTFFEKREAFLQSNQMFCSLQYYNIAYRSILENPLQIWHAIYSHK